MGTSSQAYGINPLDEIVGVSDTGALDAGGAPVHHAFRWSPGEGIIDLFPADTQLDSEAHGINLFGTIGGFHDTGGPTHAFLYTPELGAITDPHSNNNWIYAVNNADDGAGKTLYPDGTEEEWWYQLSGSSVFGLGNSNNYNAMAYGLADPAPGEGIGDTAGVMYHGSVPHAYYSLDFGVPIDVSSDGGDLSAPAGAYAINNDRAATGYATYSYSLGGVHMAVVFDAYAGIPFPIGTLIGQSWSEGHGINEFSEVVGKSGPYAFLSTADERPQDLNGLIAPRSGWVITDADAINDLGDIVGQGFHNGQSHAVLLLPVILQSFTLSSNSIIGGQTPTGTVTLSGPAPFTLHVGLGRSRTGARPPHTVTIREGNTSGSFTIPTSAVGRNLVVTLTASFGGVVLDQTLTLMP